MEVKPIFACLVLLVVHTECIPYGQGAIGHNAIPPPIPTEPFPVYAQLDSRGEYFLFWKRNTTHITFEAHVKTLGYVGFGISHNGNMYPADIVIGWVENGRVNFTDRYTLGHYEPVIDDSQDWTLLAGFERDHHTILKFVRPLDTCDDKHDIKIKDETIRVIYSYHPDDPLHETGLTYHGSERRGSKSLMLLDDVPTERKMPPETKHFDFINKKFVIPPQRTFYHCTAYKLPELSQKHHMFKWEAVLQPGNEDLVHHMLVYTCPGHINPSRDGVSYECYNHHSPRDLLNCKAVFIAWAVGGDAFSLPDHVGVSIGTATDPQFVVLETHYNNPGGKRNVVDSSGMRMYYTPTLRQYDAGMLFTGVSVDEMQIIPPEFDNFVSRGFCSPACTAKLAGQSGGVKVIAAFLHAHLLSTGITTRHFRNGVELAPIMNDEHYDFDFQEYRLLKEERLITKGDFLQTECYYTSRGQKRSTYGGLGTDDEMCLSFLMYYPKAQVFQCVAVPEYNQYRASRHTSESALRRYLETLDWTNATVRDEFQTNTDESLYVMSCDEDNDIHKYTTEEAPKILQPYSEPVNTACLHD